MVFKSKSYAVVRLELSADGKYVLAITRKFPKRTEAAQLFETHTAAELKRWENYNSGGKWCAFTNDSTSIIVAGSDRSVVEWSLPTVEKWHSFAGFYASVNAVAVSDDSKYVLAGADDTKARIWDRSKAKMLATLSGHTDAVLSVASSSDAALAIKGSTDNHAIIWAWQNNPQTAKTDIAAGSPVYSVALSTNKM